MIKYIFRCIGLFSTISLLSLLPSLNTPWHRLDEGRVLKIGFPFEFYHEMMVECPIPNTGWNLDSLMIDLLIVLAIVGLVGLGRKMIDKKQNSFKP